MRWEWENHVTESASRLNVEPWVELFLELELVVTVECCQWRIGASKFRQCSDERVLDLDGLTLGIALGLAVTVTDNNWHDNSVQDSVYPERS